MDSIKVFAFDLNGVIYRTAKLKAWEHNFIRHMAEDFQVNLELVKTAYFATKRFSVKERNVVKLYDHLALKLKNWSRFPDKVGDGRALLEYELTNGEDIWLDAVMAETLMRIKSSGFTLTYLSNSLIFHLQKLIYWGLVPDFTPGVYSGRDHVRKPNPRAYNLLKDRVKNLTKVSNEVLFIDDKGKNLIPARSAGFKTYRFEGSKRFLNYCKENYGI